MANIRSNYIKNLLADKEDLGKTLEESTKEALKGIVDEAINKNLRTMISEANEDDYEEEEVNDTENIVDEPETSDKETNDEVALEEPAESGDDEEKEDTEEEGLWDSLDQYKGEDGEYDLTGMDSEEVIKVLKVMKPEDGVRVVKNDNGTIELTDDENDTEYIIEIGDDEIDVDVERDEDEDNKDEDVFDIEVDECGGMPVEEGKVDLGYTDNYQDKTAMTMDPDDGEKTRKWNAGTPTGNGKRWVGNKGDMSPFNKKVNEAEEPIVEVVLDDEKQSEIDENATSVANQRTDASHDEFKDTAVKKRHRGSSETSKNPTTRGSEANEALKRKATAILKENQQLKAIAEQIKERLNEACVINASLGKIIKLVTENTTTRDEKIDIVNRFNDVKTVNEGKALYETISKELKNSHPINNVDKMMSGPLTEAKKTNIVETPMFQSADLTETLDLMKRLDKIK